MLGTILILFWIVCISTFIYVIKNYSFVKQKINEHIVLKGIVFSLVLIGVIIIITSIIIYGLYALDNFGIIDANTFLEGM